MRGNAAGDVTAYMKRALLYNAVLNGVMLGIAFWLVDCGVDSLVFKESTFANNLISPSPVEIWARSFVLALLVGFSVYSHRVITGLKEAGEALMEANLKLERKAEESTASYHQEHADRRRIEEILANVAKIVDDERVRTDAIIEGLGVGVIIQDMDYKVMYENDLQQKTAGRHVGEYCYKAYERRDEICPGCPMVLSLADGGIHRLEREIPTSEGIKHFELISSPLKDSSGNIIGGIKVVKDITKLKELEERVLHAYKMDTIGTLSAGIAHEYNNIISIIKGASEFLEEGIPDDSPLRRYVEVMQDSTDRAAELTRGLLTYSRRHVYNPEPVDVNAVILGIEELLRKIIGTEVDLKINLNGEDMTVMADRNHLEQALINLVTNAKDAIPRGGRITITTEPVEIDSALTNAEGFGCPGRFALISVKDTGTGIEEPVRRRLFDPFFTTKDVGKGTGLGLSMVYGIIRKHGGHIDLHSKPGKGSIFVIYLPLYEPGAQNGQSWA